MSEYGLVKFLLFETIQIAQYSNFAKCVVKVSNYKIYLLDYVTIYFENFILSASGDWLRKIITVTPLYNLCCCIKENVWIKDYPPKVNAISIRLDLNALSTLLNNLCLHGNEYLLIPLISLCSCIIYKKLPKFSLVHNMILFVVGKQFLKILPLQTFLCKSKT